MKIWENWWSKWNSFSFANMCKFAFPVECYKTSIEREIFGDSRNNVKIKWEKNRSDVNNIFKSLPHLDTQMALILGNKFFRTFWGWKSLLVLIVNFGLSQQKLKNSPKRQLFELSCLWFTSAKAPSENEIGSYFGFFIWSVFNFWLLLMSG